MIDRLVMRHFIGWVALAVGIVVVMYSTGVLVVADASELPSDNYLAGVWVRTLNSPFQLALALALVCLPGHAASLALHRGDDDGIALSYGQFAEWGQVLFTSFGFLGTIVGVTIAVSGLPEAMKENDPDTLITGLSTAFDTTFLGLSAAIFLLVMRKTFEVLFN